MAVANAANEIGTDSDPISLNSPLVVQAGKSEEPPPPGAEPEPDEEVGDNPEATKDQPPEKEEDQDIMSLIEAEQPPDYNRVQVPVKSLLNFSVLLSGGKTISTVFLSLNPLASNVIGSL